MGISEEVVGGEGGGGGSAALFCDEGCPENFLSSNFPVICSPKTSLTGAAFQLACVQLSSSPQKNRGGEQDGCTQATFQCVTTNNETVGRNINNH